MTEKISKSIINFKALVAVAFTISLILFSESGFSAAVEGLDTWWKIVFPALLPFFIIAEILMGLGVVHFLGVLLEPLMKPLFKVPGVGAFALAMGLASGYPIGAKITAQLRREQLCTQAEGERLISFTNTADPLFMVGAVAVGMFARPELGLVLALAHYLSCLAVGFIMRFYNPSTNDQTTVAQENNTASNIINRAFKKLYQAQREDGRSFGQLLGDAIKEAVNTLLLIGGFIIFFSVLTQILADIGFTKLLSILLSIILKPLGIKKTMILPLVGGLFEITNGSNLASQAAAPLNQQLVITSGVIAWSGLSVHAQVMTMINGTDLRIKPYLWARVLHGFLASIITYLLVGPANILGSQLLQPVTFSPQYLNVKINYLGYISQISFGILIILTASILLSLIMHLIKRITVISFHYFG
ncbi:sporulation integral membrane protein YlbJ [Halanaerobacter jeridensis]|uniref:Sporulation integral membrane protein YlbJ n=1 Tax=Halanaerobacter jeridensis TaxID=706427 RepID=A0A938XRP2_9FIRM|nr:sporulation integral membrane protein YlbJ [Halanaerobacter jeridensis]MBM7556426.1 sporulation integral membrane protein YlbJ [Halanaerobacter jeridensis]